MSENESIQIELAAWFKQQSPEQLTDFLMGFINRNSNEQARWQLAMINDKGSLNKAKISKMITKVLPAKALWEWNKVARYFSHADDMFETIFPAIKKYSAVVQWQLILKALQRLNKVLENIDDSGGCRFDLEGQLKQQLTQLFNQQPWTDKEKAQWVFEHFKEYKYDVFPSVPEDFDLTEKVRASFLSLCSIQAQKQIELGVNLTIWEDRWALKWLIEPLIKQAMQINDWQEQCRLMAMSVFNVDDYLAIAQVCLDADSALDSEHWLQKAYQKTTELQTAGQQVNNSRDKRASQSFEVKLRLALNETKKAWQLAWQLFNESPSFNAFKQLEILEQQTGIIDRSFIEKSEQVLKACYVETHYGIANNADALLDFYLDRHELEKALKWTKSHKAASSTLRQLADIIVSEYPQDAVNLYYRVIDTVIDQKKNSAYQEATKLLLNLKKKLIVNGVSDDIFLLMIQKVIQKHKAKRNLMKLLKEHFADFFEV